jgi:asparagine synthase (glutamine-hydrolysing)
VCGIAGILNFGDGEPASRDEILAMTDTLAQRGPDDEGLFLDGELALGHRRLSIIDLAEGRQPLADEKEAVWTVFNGEIYNFEELRGRLQSGGHRFRTRTDTEVLVHGYEERGDEVVDDLRGMFAFAIWDRSHRTLLLARDRFGKKPLYVAEARGRMAFASEMKALLTLPWVDTNWDASGLRAYLDLGYIPGDLTAYRGIRKVLPGTIEVWRGAGTESAGKERWRTYWEPRAVPVEPLPTYDQACAELAERLHESVNIRLRSDVPLGAFLSGGIDSTCIVAMMRQCGVKDLKTFSIGFEGESRSDVPYAEQAARSLGTDHHTLVHTAADAGLVGRVLDLFDEPYADSSAMPMFLVSQLAREHVTVALSGDGGDELFAGYSQYPRFDRFRTIDRLPLSLQRAARAVGSRVIPEGAKGGRLVRMLAVPPGERVSTPMAGLRLRVMSQLLGDECTAFLDECCGERYWQPSFSPDATVTELQLHDQRNYLVDDILAKVDRCSMAVSLEARAPLLDHHLAEWVNGLPCEYKLRHGMTKALLRDAVQRHIPGVPASVLTREKKGFGVPLNWMWGPLRGFVEARLLAAPDGLLDRDAVTRLLAEPPVSRDHAVSLWVILNLASWAGRHPQAPW